MTGEVSQHVEDNHEEQPYDLGSLKRELWMRVLGIKPRAQSPPSSESQSMTPATTESNPRMIGH